MLDAFTCETFVPHVGSAFRLNGGEQGSLQLVLKEAVEMGSEGSRPKDARHPFSLVFFSEVADPVLEQAIYGVSHDTLGTMELFLVPLGPDEDARGMRYEAVFT